MRRIGIFTKMDMAGGSEMRAIELANGIARVPGFRSVLLVEKGVPERMAALVGPEVEFHSGIFVKPLLEPLYSLDHLLVINSDSRQFTQVEYWLGQCPAHSFRVNLERIGAMTFLFNFIVSPSCQLPLLQKCVRDIRIITTNRRFFDEISQQERYRAVRHYPRARLESPIDPSVRLEKSTSARLRLGMHSLPVRSKWNEQWPALIEEVNRLCGDRVEWDFMGMPDGIAARISAENSTFRPAFSIPVSEYLRNIDIFVFFLEWKREEAWARSAGEALMSGCPVITTAKGGNRDQVVHGNNGFLCASFSEFGQSCQELIENPALLAAMQANARSCARAFSSDEITARLLRFLD